MCELFAINGSAPTAATFSFTGFSARGGATGEHVDGWGMALHEGDACRVFVDAGRACDSPLAEFLRRHPLRARTVLAHVRKATQGPVSLANCHPFQREWAGRHWVFAHNGDLKGFRPELDGSFLPVGQTDSEYAFCWLLQRLRQRFGPLAAPPWPQMLPVLAEDVTQIAAHGSFNMLLADGRAVFAHASTRLTWLQRRWPFGTAHLVDHELAIDLGTANQPGDRMVVVATAPLTRDEPWRTCASGEMLLLVDGELAWHSQRQAEAALA